MRRNYAGRNLNEQEIVDSVPGKEKYSVKLPSGTKYTLCEPMSAANAHFEHPVVIFERRRLATE